VKKERRTVPNCADGGAIWKEEKTIDGLHASVFSSDCPVALVPEEEKFWICEME